MLNRLAEAFRRLLLIIFWSPTVIFFGAILFNLEDVLPKIDQVIMIGGACVFGSFLAHFTINWIFQVNERPPLNIEETEVEYEDGPLMPEAYMEKNSTWHTILGFGWIIGIIWLGHYNNNYSTIYWGMWSSVDSFKSYYSAMWPYFLIGFGGCGLFFYLVRRNYERYLKRLGY
jgi:hypothetical protein